MLLRANSISRLRCSTCVMHASAPRRDLGALATFSEASFLRASTVADFAERIIAWQKVYGRHDLPWQRTRDPYCIWLSEIMLQQTQVATVIPYYERFVRQFADVRALASAPIESVMACWAGLGYYSRAHNLHRCAQQIAASHGGEFPRSVEFSHNCRVLAARPRRRSPRLLSASVPRSSTATSSACWRDISASKAIRAAPRLSESFGNAPSACCPRTKLKPIRRG